MVVFLAPVLESGGTGSDSQPGLSQIKFASLWSTLFSASLESPDVPLFVVCESLAWKLFIFFEHIQVWSP